MNNTLIALVRISCELYDVCRPFARAVARIAGRFSLATSVVIGLPMIWEHSWSAVVASYELADSWIKVSLLSFVTIASVVLESEQFTKRLAIVFGMSSKALEGLSKAFETISKLIKDFFDKL